MEFRPLQSLTTRRQPHSLLKPCGASHEVWSPSALEERGSHDRYAGFTSPDYDPPSGFLTLLASCSPANPAALFHAAGAHGVVPFRAFPSGPNRCVSRRSQPSWRWESGLGVLETVRMVVRHAGLPTRAVRASLTFASCSPPSGRGTRPESVVDRLGLTARPTRCSPGVLGLFRASQQPDLAMVSPPPLLPWDLPTRPPHHPEG